MTEDQELVDRAETEGGESDRAPREQQPLVVYHSPCLDGFTAAWAMWLKYPDAEFVPGIYGQAPPDCAGRDVFLLDFSYKRPVLREIVAVANSVVVLDHHKTAEADLGDLLTEPLSGLHGKFDMTKSGARLAWEWFHPSVPVPMLIKYVEDRDLGNLWRKEGPTYKATGPINALLFSYEYDFEVWNAANRVLKDRQGHLNMTAEGLAIERKHKKDIAELVPKLRGWMRFKDLQMPVPAINLPYTMASDAGNILAQGAPFAAVFYQNGTGDIVFSLRSIEGGMDVSEIAKVYGGGGHKHAAGFQIKSLEDL